LEVIRVWVMKIRKLNNLTFAALFVVYKNTNGHTPCRRGVERSGAIYS